MAGNNNENDINEITNFDESAIMNSLEVHSTPNVGQDKIIELNITDKINVTDDSGIQLTPKLTRESNKNKDENVSFTDSQTESQITSDSSETKSKLMDELIHSTPVPIKKSEDYDMIKMMQLLLEKNTMLCTNFSEQSAKLNELSSDFNIKFDEQSRKFNKLKIDINEVKNKCESGFNELKRDIEKMGEW